MIAQIQKVMNKKAKYSFDSYSMKEANVKRSKLFPILSVLVLLIIIGYFLQTSGIISSEYYGLEVVIFAFLFLVLVPLAFHDKKKFKYLVYTKEYLIKVKSKKDVEFVRYDDIRSFSYKNDTIVLKDENNTLSLYVPYIKNELTTIIQILEAKGKTFDRNKAYMIRDIKLDFKDNKVIMYEIEAPETKTEKVMKAMYEEYKSITPGFTDEINIINSYVDKSSFKGGDLYFRLNRIDVLDNHPENTSFQTLTAKNAVLIFINPKIRAVIKREQGKKDQELEPSLKSVILNTHNGIVSSFSVQKNKIEFKVGVGVAITQMTIVVDDVIIGWKEIE
ncbi:MAG: hypothetical protein ACVCEJ_00630 [Candidatus Izemoplasmataceae bacterium]